MPRRPDPARASALVRYGAFPVAVALTGLVWATVDVFVLGNWDPTFGPWGTFELELAVLAPVTMLAGLVGPWLTWRFRKRTAGWTTRRHVLVGAGAGILSMALLASGAALPVLMWITQPFDNPFLILVVACGLLFSVVLVAGILAGGLAPAAGPRAECGADLHSVGPEEDGA